MKISNLTNAKLNEEISSLKLKIAELKFDLKSGVLNDLKEYKNTKLDLARALTEKRFRELGKVTKIAKPKKEVEEEKPQVKKEKDSVVKTKKTETKK